MAALLISLFLAAPAWNFQLTDANGKMHSAPEWKDKRAVVLLFLSTECPISNRYAPAINRLYNDYSRRQVLFYVVQSDPDLTAQAAQKHAADFGFQMPVLMDPRQVLASKAGASVTPTAVVLSADADILYQGRIDDRNIDLGQYRDNPKREDLKIALDEVLAGKPVSERNTKVVGCFLPPPSGEITFNKDIAPILYKNCATCHRPGEVAPFSLLSYSDAAKRAALIANVTSKRYMPPWKPEPGYGEFTDETRLSDREIQTIARWVEQGAPEGDAKDKIAPPQFQDGWQLGKPDLIVQMSQPFIVPAEGRDIYRCFVLPLNLPEDRYVSAIEFRPGNRRVLHHSILHTEEPGPDRERDAATPGPGYNCFGGGGGVTGEGGLGGWVPGATPHFLPEDTARLVPRGSDLIIQNHYHPSGKPESDQATVGIYFAKTAPSKTILTLPIVQRNLSIPAGDPNYRVEASFVTPIDLHVIGISPHMHLLGHDMKVTAVRPDGSEVPMIWIKNWDFNWQGQYEYPKPLLLPAGTRIQMEAHYDNSSGNPRNPNDPPRTVRWGEQTTDEMSIAFVPVILSSTAERRRLLSAVALQLRNAIPAGRGGLPPALRAFLSSPLGLQILFTQMSEGNDTITRPQFRKFISQYPQVPAALFDLLDSNEDGSISKEEFQQLSQLIN